MFNIEEIPGDILKKCLPINFSLLDKYESINENDLAPRFLYCFALLQNNPSTASEILEASKKLCIPLVNKNEIDHIRFKINNWNTFVYKNNEYYNNCGQCENKNFHRICKRSKKAYHGTGRGYVYWINTTNWDIFSQSVPYIPLEKNERKQLKKIKLKEKRKRIELIDELVVDDDIFEKKYRSIGTCTSEDNESENENDNNNIWNYNYYPNNWNIHDQEIIF